MGRCAEDPSYFEPLLIHFSKLAKVYQAALIVALSHF